MAYDNGWNAADQIPRRAVTSGLIDTYGSLDNDAGGESNRYSLSASLQGNGFETHLYAVRYGLDLFSDFTYYLDDSVNGDEFEQVDKRSIFGGDARYGFAHDLGGVRWHQHIGTQLRYDDIDEVGLYHTAARRRLAAVRSDAVKEGSAGFYWQGRGMLNDALTLTGAALRSLFRRCGCAACFQWRHGRRGILSPKFNLIYALNDDWETYLSAGEGFHSSDARGATIAIDPASGEAATPVDLLVKTRGGEIGVRYYDAEAIHLSLALWALDIDSELLYVGDAGTTEANRASRRYGAEFSGYYWIGEALGADLELAFSHARFKEDDAEEGDYIEGSLPFVAAAGLTYAPAQGVFGALRMRHFGARTLDGTNDHRSDPFDPFQCVAGVSDRRVESVAGDAQCLRQR